MNATAKRSFAAATAAGEQGRFFALLVAATLIPYILLPVQAHLLRDSIGIEQVSALALFLGANGHVGASFFFYDDRAMRTFMLARGRARFLLVPTALVLLGAALFAFGDGRVQAHAITVFWVWQVHHFTRQNHGILAFASRGAGLPPTLAERTALTLTNVAGILGTLVLMTPYRDSILAMWGWQLYAVGLGAYAAAWITYAISLGRAEHRVLSWRSVLVLLMMLFYLPLFVFDDAFTGVFTFLTAHGLQYLVFMGYVVTRSEMSMWRALGSVTAMTFGLGYTIKLMQSGAPLTVLGSTMLGAAYGVIVWHFLLDARVWRLSEPFQRSYMRRRFDFLLAAPDSPSSR